MVDSVNRGAVPIADEAATTHQRLLAAAAALFAERGYGGTSMADIADRVGVRKASLYNYYPSKEEILMHLLRQGIEAWGNACSCELAGDGPLGDRLWHHLRSAFRFADEHPEMVAIFRVAATQIGGELGERAMSEVQAYKLEHRRELEAAFERAVEAGEVRRAPTEDLSFAFRMFANGVVSGHLTHHKGQGRLTERRLRRVWDLFWNGIAADPGREAGEESALSEERE